MQGLSERQYADRVGLSRGAIQKAKAAGRLVLFADGSINATASDRRRAEATDPSKTRKAPSPKLKPVPEAAVSAVGDTLREQGLAAPITSGGTTFLQAKTANEVLKAQERRLKLQKLKGELVDRDRAEALGQHLELLGGLGGAVAGQPGRLGGVVGMRGLQYLPVDPCVVPLHQVTLGRDFADDPHRRTAGT